VSALVVVTTSYPERPGDAQGHFVAAEVRRLTATHDVTVLAPGNARKPLGNERVVSLGGGAAFGFPGALARLREQPLRALAASAFAMRALGWLRLQPAPERIIAHFLLPCGVPISSLGRRADTKLEIVVHGSDARLFAALGPARSLVTRELLRSRAELRCVSPQLCELMLAQVTTAERLELAPRVRVEPCAIEVPTSSRAEARVALGLEPRTTLVVIAARLVPGKRVGVALEACRAAGDLEVVVLGDGPERAELSQRFPDARFVGHVSRDLALSWVAAADALVSASRLEGAPTVVREARALGTPVVCLEAGDLRAWAEKDAGIQLADGDHELGPKLSKLIAASSATASLS
jgi:glycosyltransferase involved in cell wall biosynthesis